MSDSVLQINVRRLREFFDEKVKGSEKHATAIASVCGEDLGCGLLKHYFEAHGASVEVRPEPVVPGGKKGPRLDRWMRVRSAAELGASDVLLQVEVKMWSAHAIGGESLPLRAMSEQVAEYKVRSWQKEWDETRGIKKESLSKVPQPMRPPADLADIPVRLPLACMWTALHPDGGPACLFSVPLPEEQANHFSHVWFFSMSSYLRSLTEERIALVMPDATRRIRWLRELFGP